jgi:lipoprotein-releasing system permease protein
MLQQKTNFIPLDPTSYYLRSVPINLDPVHIILLNIGTMIAILGMLLIPSQIIARITPVKAIRYN